MLRRSGVALVLMAGFALAAESSSAEPGSTKFVSKRYGYELTLEGSWRAKYARRAWRGDFPLMDSGEVDVFSASGDRHFIVAATKLARGTTLRSWERRHAKVMATGFPGCRAARAFRNTRIGGVRARRFLGGCLVHDAIVIVAVRNGRGYTFQFVSPSENSQAADEQQLNGGRRTFRFRSN